MNSYFVTVSPKGQITIPVAERKKLKSSKYILACENGTFQLNPVKSVTFNEQSKDYYVDNFGRLAESSFDFWQGANDDIYAKHYFNKAKKKNAHQKR